MTFIHWVAHIFGAGVSKVEDLVRMIRAGLSGLWQILTGLGRNVRKSWARYLRAHGWLVGWIVQAAHGLASDVRWLYRTVVPAAIRHALSAAATFALHQVAAMGSALRGAITWLQNHLVGMIHDLTGWAQSAVRWLTAHLARVASDLATTMRRVWSLLDDPAHLAEWAIGAIIGAALRWGQRNAVTLGRWFVRNGVRTVLDEVGTVEDWLARII